jgi:hypothetical protein
MKHVAMELKDKLKARRSSAENSQTQPQRRHVIPAVITNGLAAAVSPAGVCPLSLKWLMVTSTLPPTQTALNRLISQVWQPILFLLAILLHNNVQQTRLAHNPALCLQMRNEATEKRCSSITQKNVTPGVWNSICIVLTGQFLPPEYRWGMMSDASSFLRTLRGKRCIYNKLGLYMLQIKNVDFDTVRIPQSTFTSMIKFLKP